MLGASVAGLLSARVLADHFDHVVVVDRDDLDAELDAPRRGVPQGRHTHGLLVRGTDAIVAILPGFAQELVSRGAMQADVLMRSRWVTGDNLLSRGPSGLVGLLASRTLVESEVRRRVRRVPGVGLLGRQDIGGVLATPDHRRVTGGRVTPRRDPAGPSSTDAPDGLDLPADLVVDATGRGSRAPVWFRELGYAPPEQMEVDAQVVYMTRLFEARPGVLDDLDADIVGTRPPSGRGGVALRQEGNRWTVTLPGSAASRLRRIWSASSPSPPACPPMGSPGSSRTARRWGMRFPTGSRAAVGFAGTDCRRAPRH